MSRKAVRRPRIDLDARGRVETHGRHQVVRGVWHDTECGDAPGTRDLEAIVGFWEEQNQGLGAHVIIDKDGNSALCGNPSQVMWAVAGRNTGSFHIELVGFARFTPKVWLARPAQLDKLARWMAWLSLEYGIDLKYSVDLGWSGHRDQPDANHTDPGRWFPRRRVLKLAQQYLEDGWA